MQPAEAAHSFDSRTQIEVIGIAEKDLNAEFLENVLGHALYCRCRTDRHEHRGFDLAVRRDKPPGASLACTGLDMELNGHSSLLCDCSNGAGWRSVLVHSKGKSSP